MTVLGSNETGGLPMNRWVIWFSIPVILVAFAFLSYSGPKSVLPGFFLLFLFPWGFLTVVAIAIKSVRWLVGSSRAKPSSSSVTR